MSLSSAGTKAATQVENGNFRLSTGVLEYSLVTTYITKQPEEKHTPSSPYPKFCLLKTSPPKPLGSLELLSTSHWLSLLGPAINLSLLQTLFQFGFMDLHLVTTLHPDNLIHHQKFLWPAASWKRLPSSATGIATSPSVHEQVRYRDKKTDHGYVSRMQ